jgi:hypothetical protein
MAARVSAGRIPRSHSTAWRRCGPSSIAREKDVPEAATLLRNDHVHHYWNPTGSFGRELADGLDLKMDGEDVYAWDVWLVYAPDAVWDGEVPPKPEYLMHQLRALGGTDLPRLDSKVFAEKAHQLLGTVHP